MIRFLQPEWLWLLTLLPLALLWRGRRGAVAAVQYSNVSLARQVARQTRSRAGRWVWLLPILAGALMVVGLARPQFGHGRTEAQASGIDIVLALDVSGSMQALDFKLDGQPANRIDVVKSVVAKFIRRAPQRPHWSGRICRRAVPRQSAHARPRLASAKPRPCPGRRGRRRHGHRLGDRHLRQPPASTPAKSKVVVLLTDGMNNTGKISPAAAAEAAKALGVKVYTIAAGVRGEAPVPVKDNFGNTQLVMAKVDVDEETLQKIAAETGGKFYRATDTDSLKHIYAEINRLETTTQTVRKFERYQELFAWALFPALGVLGLAVGLEQTRYRRLP